METGLFSFDIIRDVLLENYDNVMKSYGDEAIDDAMKTIKDSFDKGAYAVELECGYIVENLSLIHI